MKIQNSDVKNLSDLGGAGNESKMIQATQVYIGASGIDKTLHQAIEDKTLGDSGLATIVNPTTNTYDVDAVPNEGNIVHTQSNSCIYNLPSALSSDIKSFTFQHKGSSPTNSTDIVIDTTNNKVYFKRSGTDYTATLASSTYTYATLGTEVASKMNAQDSNSYTCTFDMTNRNFKISGSAAFQLMFGSNTTNSANVVLMYEEADTDSLVDQFGFSVDNCMIIKPFSGDLLKWRSGLIENPGYLKINKRGVSLRVTNIDDNVWFIDRVVSENHEKNSTIGFEKDVALVGRDSWASKAGGGTARRSLAGFSLNGYGYICNGGDGTNRSYVDQYNDSANTWTAKAGGGTARQNSAGFSLNGYGYICDGYTTSAVSYVDQYNDSANTWTSKAGGGTARYGLTGFSLNGYGYICNGYDGAPSSAVNQYNDSANTWTSKAGSGTARQYLTGFSLNGYGYICNGTDGTLRSYVDQYNDSANSWVSKAGGGTARAYMAGFSLNGYGYICDGYNGVATWFSYVDQYNDSANTWTSKAGGGTARNSLAGFNLNGYGYICNGYDGTNRSYVDQYN